MTPILCLTGSIFLAERNFSEIWTVRLRTIQEMPLLQNAITYCTTYREFRNCLEESLSNISFKKEQATYFIYNQWQYGLTSRQIHNKLEELQLNNRLSSNLTWNTNNIIVNSTVKEQRTNQIRILRSLGLKILLHRKHFFFD